MRGSRAPVSSVSAGLPKWPRGTTRLLSFEWKAKKNGTLDELTQRLVVISPVQTALATWRSKDNRTRITSVVGGQQQQTTVPSMFLLRLATNGGALSIETTP